MKIHVETPWQGAEDILEAERFPFCVGGNGGNAALVVHFALLLATYGLGMRLVTRRRPRGGHGRAGRPGV